jgi:hypothetical protein
MYLGFVVHRRGDYILDLHFRISSPSAALDEFLDFVHP